MNRTRKARWDFIFLAEVLDPDAIQYRLNRVFDVLTTKDHYLYRKNDLKMTELFRSLESESQLFGGEALVEVEHALHKLHKVVVAAVGGKGFSVDLGQGESSKRGICTAVVVASVTRGSQP